MTRVRLSPETEERRRQMRRYIRGAAVLIDAADRERDPIIKSRFLAAAKAQVEEAQAEQVWVHAVYEWAREATRKPLPGGRRRGDVRKEA